MREETKKEQDAMREIARGLTERYKEIVLDQVAKLPNMDATAMVSIVVSYTILELSKAKYENHKLEARIAKLEMKS